MQRFLSSKGFTLIELLVTIAVIGILAGGTIAAVDPLAQFKKARDAQILADMKMLDTALESYYNDYGAYPVIPTTSRSCRTASSPDVNVDFIPGLKAGKYVKEMPIPPSGKYCYYRYGAGTEAGALLSAELQTMTPTNDTTKQYRNTCRPINFTNWCRNNYAADKMTTEYCLCHPF